MPRNPVAPTIAAALAEEKLRIRQILTAPEASNKTKLAMTLALDSAMTADEAVNILNAAAPEHSTSDRFLAAMNREGALNIDSSGAQPTGDGKAARMAELAEAADRVRVNRYGVPPKSKRAAR